jgi:hypothetical protein
MSLPRPSTLPHFVLWICLCSGTVTRLMAQDASTEEWIPLFNGQDLAGWTNAYEWGEAKVVNGEIHLTASRKFFLTTEQTFGDFVLEGEVLLPEGEANSGFMFRCHVEPNRVYGYQAEVDGSDRRWSGGLYDEGRRGWLWPSQKGRTEEPEALEHEEKSKEFFRKPEVRDALKRNDWNRYQITCQGDQLRIMVNGVVTTEYEDAVDATGHIGIQHHGEDGQTYRFRHLRLRPL